MACNKPKKYKNVNRENHRFYIIPIQLFTFISIKYVFKSHS